ncbi:recombinase family protein [Rhodanobacter sp. L36]|uniref:recombinase family protein n=1 Tax=Rhodanobacter sp. L36 TaxID=1747221 RepID=UPI00131EB8FC|nr:recombinase family protein [Rhodanobacter sp. L36]
MTDTRSIRCAIYTRKSSEEGLEQSFNSLDAQREACEAYITSQRHEGWQCLPNRYDDGGFSGGNLKRPALEALMVDLRSGKVDLIVVYKIDRLTRSLMDFSSLVATFDTHKASFVSVTQHFNTTTSMGRLTLNVLLSFAQFEREVTGERIRDKIAASKRKGMWMGGRMPLGYCTKDRQLLIKEDDAAFVRHLFMRYLELKSVALLKLELDRAVGKRFSRGALYLLLKNRLYKGEIVHKELVHAGQHEAIVSTGLWEEVQRQLDANRDERKIRAGEEEASLLSGLLFDKARNRLTPTHAVKRGRRYRYYTRRAGVGESAMPKLSVPAHSLDAIVTDTWRDLLKEADLDQTLEVPDERAEAGLWLRQAATALHDTWASRTLHEQRLIFETIGVKVVVDQDALVFSLPAAALRGYLLHDEDQPAVDERSCRIERRRHITVDRLGGERRVLDAAASQKIGVTARHEVLLATMARGRRWYEDLTQGRAANIADIAHREGVTDASIHHVLQCALVPAAQIQRLLDGQADPDFSRASALRGFQG